MNAGQIERNWLENAVPRKEDIEHKIDWMNYVKKGQISDDQILVDWVSKVPGSNAPCHLVIAAIQAMRNKGYCVEEAEEYMETGLEAVNNKDYSTLQRVTAKIYYLLNNAKLNKDSDYHKFKKYTSWEEISAKISFDEFIYDINSDSFAESIKAGWIAQLIGGALGTQIEGYTKRNIEKVFGKNISTYLRHPETYNDDITYELVFLEAFEKKGNNITSNDIAEAWLELIADGYSAERIALENLRRGHFPPNSGLIDNYFSDWIGVQMRTMVHGMVAPGNPKLAAKLSIYDGVVSHSNSGILGGMFNAVMVSLAFVEKDMKKVIEKAIKYIPDDSEYYSVISYALQLCKSYSNWEVAWAQAEGKYKYYNWIHVYPNIVAEIIALWFGNNDFEETTKIICGCGLDVDCTAAPVLNILAIATGSNVIKEELILPLNNEVKTILRDKRIISIDNLIKKTINLTRDANK